MRWFAFLVLVMLSSFVTRASAQTCTISASDLTFGIVDVLLNSAVDTTGTVTMRCTGTANEIVRVCLNINYPNGSQPDGNTRIALGGNSSLAFQLYSDTSYRQIWGSWQQGSMGGLEVDVPIGPDGNSLTVQRMIYGRVFGGQSLIEPANYLASFSGSHTLYTASYARGIPCEALVSGAKRFPFKMTARVPSKCAVTTATMDFGIRTSLGKAIDASTNFGIVCSKGLPYQIAVDGGQSAATNPSARKMQGGGGFVLYGLYRDAARITPWGEIQNSNTFSATGNGMTQSIPVYGRIPVQPTPIPGEYTDNVVVTIIY